MGTFDYYNYKFNEDTHTYDKVNITRTMRSAIITIEQSETELSFKLAVLKQKINEVLDSVIPDKALFMELTSEYNLLKASAI